MSLWILWIRSHASRHVFSFVYMLAAVTVAFSFLARLSPALLPWLQHHPRPEGALPHVSDGGAAAASGGAASGRINALHHHQTLRLFPVCHQRHHVTRHADLWASIRLWDFLQPLTGGGWIIIFPVLHGSSRGSQLISWSDVSFPPCQEFSYPMLSSGAAGNFPRRRN